MHLEPLEVELKGTPGSAQTCSLMEEICHAPISVWMLHVLRREKQYGAASYHCAVSFCRTPAQEKCQCIACTAGF